MVDEFDAIIIGGGPAGLTAGIYLARAKVNPKIDFIIESEIQEFKGDKSLESVTIKNMRTGESFDKDIDGAFILIGYIPSTEKVKGIVELNEIVTDENLSTNINGVFAAGDSRVKKHRQITTAVSDGTIAVLNTIEYLEKVKDLELV